MPILRWSKLRSHCYVVNALKLQRQPSNSRLKGEEVETSIAAILSAEFGTGTLALFEVTSFILPRFAEFKQGRAPGIYVITNGSEVYRVGKSQTNAYKRSLQHFEDNTGGKLAVQKTDELCKVVLITVRTSIPREKYLHWITAFEIFLELNLHPRPSIHSRRIG